MRKLVRGRSGLLVALAGAGLLLGGPGGGLGADRGSGPGASFAVATVYMEQNATDGDAEIVFEAKAGKEGLAKLTVTAPDGRTVIDFAAPGASTSLGIRQFRFETPEPRDAASLRSAYPEGVYTFAGATAGGERLRGEATLSHALPAPTSLLRPSANAREVDARSLRISWSPVESVAAYIVKIEQRTLGMSLVSTLPGSVAAFGVPDGFLRAGLEYKLAVGTVSSKGNISFVETSFATARRP